MTRLASFIINVLFSKRESKLQKSQFLMISLYLLLSFSSVYSQDTYRFWPTFNIIPDNNINTISAQPWINAEGVIDGWDWSMPDFVEPSPRGEMAFKREWSMNDRFNSNMANFKVNEIGLVWVDWRDLETTDDDFKLVELANAIDDAVSKGYKFQLRLMTAVKDKAPDFLASVPTDPDLTHCYDVSDPTYRAEYVELISKLGDPVPGRTESIADMVNRAYVGYSSASLGDEGVGPFNTWEVRSNETIPHVQERIDAWAEAFSGQEHKVFMGDPLQYGFDKGFGYRKGFVEHWWYRTNDWASGSYIDEDGYLTIDEVNNSIKNELFYGEVNEEYRTPDLDRFGGETGIVYTFFSSCLRTLQMRCTYTHLKGHLMPEMVPFMALELGRDMNDAPDVWSYLTTAYVNGNRYEKYDDEQDPYTGQPRNTRTTTSTELSEGIKTKNFERWLYQRDKSPSHTTQEYHKVDHGWSTFALESNNGKNTYSYIARKGKKIGFYIDDNWQGVTDSLAVKVSYIDEFPGTMVLTYHDGTGIKVKTHSLTNSTNLRTVTFIVPKIKQNQISEHGFDFELSEQGGGDIAVSMVRVVHNDITTGQLERDIDVLSSTDGTSDTNNMVSFYPNPVTSMLNLKFSDSYLKKNITIYNTLGQQLLSQVTHKSHFEIDTSDFSHNTMLIVGVLIGEKSEYFKILTNK